MYVHVGRRPPAAALEDGGIDLDERKLEELPSAPVPVQVQVQVLEAVHAGDTSEY